ncbi:MAG: zinc-binding dehydrogenase [Anaerolineae bacterium]|nr:zinc-binding dehydrogenase [Anaerolineae bacterium]
MKKVVILGERKAVLVDAPDPQPKDNWVVVKVHAAPMCTEYKQFIAGEPRDYLGHEAAGEVVEVAQPGRVRVGDRVVVMPTYPCGKCALCTAGDYIHCEHGYDFAAFAGSREGSATMAQYLLKPDWLLPPIPDGVSYEHASLAGCALGPTFGAFDTMGIGAFDSVLIAGAGPVGLGGIVNARFRGAYVIVAEPAPPRAARARALGATVIDPRDAGALDQIKDLTGGKGVDCAIDCSGVVPAERFCIDATRRKGRVAFVGENHHTPLPVDISPDMIRKGLTLFGSWHYNLNLFPQIMQVIQESPLIERLVSHVFPMHEIQQAFEVSASGEAAKVILAPWG